jgi:hypothetical protein
MIWAKDPIFQAGARFICPTMELFHIYKKGIEVLWREPIFFFPFIAPLMHRFYPESKVLSKPKLKQMEIVFTAFLLVYPEIRDRLLQLQDSVEEGIVKIISEILSSFSNLLFQLYVCFFMLYFAM